MEESLLIPFQERILVQMASYYRKKLPDPEEIFQDNRTKISDEEYLKEHCPAIIRDTFHKLRTRYTTEYSLYRVQYYEQERRDLPEEQALKRFVLMFDILFTYLSEYDSFCKLYTKSILMEALSMEESARFRYSKYLLDWKYIDSPRTMIHVESITSYILPEGYRKFREPFYEDSYRDLKQFVIQVNRLGDSPMDVYQLGYNISLAGEQIYFPNFDVIVPLLSMQGVCCPYMHEQYVELANDYMDHVQAYYELFQLDKVRDKTVYWISHRALYLAVCIIQRMQRALTIYTHQLYDGIYTDVKPFFKKGYNYRIEISDSIFDRIPKEVQVEPERKFKNVWLFTNYLE